MPKMLGFVIYLLPLAVVLVARIVILNYVSISGQDLSVLENRKNTLVKENMQFKKDISYISSLRYVKGQAQKGGLVALPFEFLEVPSLASR